MAPEERNEFVEDLEKCRQEFTAATSGLSETEACAKPDPERWSVLDCVEHVTVVETIFLQRMMAAQRAEAPPVDRAREAELAVSVPNRERRAQAPEPARPAGRFSSLEQALEGFHAARTRTVQFAAEQRDQVYSLALEHPRFGKLNGGEYLVIMAGHARRHADQIREIRRDLASR